MCHRARLAALGPLLMLAAVFSAATPAAEDEFLPPEQAFRYAARVEGDELAVTWTVEPGYYLYRKRLGFASNTEGVTVGEARWPAGEMHEDEFFGMQEIYRGATTFRLPLAFMAARPTAFDLALKLQGCADAGLCYPPTTWTTAVVVPATATAPADIRELLRAGAPDEEFLPADEAFRFSARMERPDAVSLEWIIAEGYYLYRDKLVVRGGSDQVALGSPRLPAGELTRDEFFGESEVYRQVLEATLPIARPAGAGATFELEVAYQGCAEAGLCYPVIRKSVMLTLPPTDVATAREVVDATPPRVSEQDRLAALIRDGNLVLVLGLFFAAGLGLAFTPCVLPMIPILSGIIAGSGDRVSPRRAFSLSLAYVLGMALTYTIAGALFAAAGQQVQAIFQRPWIIALFAVLFVILALAMFGLFELAMPAALQSRLAGLSNRQKAGTLTGSAIMGALSSLIVTACVAPPLVASLAVIGQSGDVIRGGAALFTMSLGMGAPLLVIGTSAGRLLPRAGAWMNVVKGAFGMLFLGLAVWMLARILPAALTLALWALLVFISGYCVYAMPSASPPSGAQAVRRGVGAAAMVYGVILLVGAAAGGSDPLQPLAGTGFLRGDATSAGASDIEFKRIKSVADLERELAAASGTGRPVMLDFYADWCVSCKEMEKYTFTDPAVRAALAGGVLLQADVTANDVDDQALLRHFGIFGPPTITFFDASGRELREYRLVGYLPADEFARHVGDAFSGG